MPHDAIEEVREALLAARNRGGDQNPVLWSKLPLQAVSQKFGYNTQFNVKFMVFEQQYCVSCCTMCHNVSFRDRYSENAF